MSSERIAELEARVAELEQQAQAVDYWRCPTCGGPLTADGRYPDPYCRSCEAVGL